MKALIGMSGGVDSSVAALLMLEAGYACMGVTMRLYNNQKFEDDRESKCCSLEDVEDARSVAYRLGIPYYVFNFTEDFEKQVMELMVAGLRPAEMAEILDKEEKGIYNACQRIRKKIREVLIHLDQ